MTKISPWLQLSLLGLGCACNSTSDSSDADTFDRSPMLQTISELIQNEYDSFGGSAQELKSKVSTWRDSVGSESETATRSEAQSAFRSAMRVWQKLEVMQIGPAGPASTFIGGELLRDEIYSWRPKIKTNICKIDQELLSKDYQNEDYFATHLVSAYGLDALEYLLFNDAQADGCDAPSALDDAAWNALDNLSAERSEFSLVLVNGIIDAHAALSDAFKNNFVPDFENAGEGENTLFASGQEAVNEAFAAMYYIDLRTKDVKLAIPAGLSPDCEQETCSEQLESVYAKISLDNIRSNIEALEVMFFGPMTSEAESKPSFDDFLAARGGDDVVSSMREGIDAIYTALDSVEGSFTDALQNDLEDIVAVHTAVRAVTDVMKSQMVTTLNLEIPSEAAGDND